MVLNDVPLIFNGICNGKKFELNEIKLLAKHWKALSIWLGKIGDSGVCRYMYSYAYGKSLLMRTVRMR